MAGIAVKGGGGNAEEIKEALKTSGWNMFLLK